MLAPCTEILRRQKSTAAPAAELAAALAPAPAAPEAPRRSRRERTKTLPRASDAAKPVATRREPAAKKKSQTPKQRYGVPQLGDKYDKMSGPDARDACKGMGLVQTGPLKVLVARLRDPTPKDYGRGDEARKIRRAPGGLEEGAPVEDVPVVPAGQRPAQRPAAGAKKPRAAVARPAERDTDAWDDMRRHLQGAMEAVARLDATSGASTKLSFTVLGPPNATKRKGHHKEAANLTKIGQRAVFQYASGADDEARHRTFLQCTSAYNAASNGLSECDAASDAVTGGASTLGALAPPVLLGSLEGIRRHFAKRPAKRPRKLAPQACPPTPPATEEEQERAREGTARLVAALAAEGLI
jgi:hypothetical protein